MKKRGLKQTETVLKSELKIQPVEEYALQSELEDSVSVANYILFYNPNESSPEKYQDSYSSFREWIYNSSLDMYRVRESLFRLIKLQSL